MMQAICVAPNRVTEIWPHVRSLLESALANGRGDDGIEVIERELSSGVSLLWIAWNSERQEIMAAATTKLLDVKRGTVCLITACGGRNLNQWVSHCMPEIEAYAKAEGCKYVRFEGRKGWQAIFPDYEQPWIVLEKRL